MNMRTALLLFVGVPCAFFLLGIASGNARADVTTTQAVAPTYSYSGTGGTVNPSPIRAGAVGSGMTDFERLLQKPTGSLGPAPSGVEDAVIVRDTVRPVVGGKAVPMSVVRALPLAAIAGAVARAAPYVGIALAIKDIWDANRVRPDKANVGQAERDAGAAQRVELMWTYGGSADPYPTAGAACAAFAAHEAITTPGYTISVLGVTMFGAVTAQCRAGRTPSGPFENPFGLVVGPPATETITNSMSAAPTLACAPTWDEATSTDTGPRGGVMRDGKCPTGRYTGAPFPSLKDIFQGDPATANKAPEILQDAMTKGGEDFTTDAKPLVGSLTGPAQSTGTPTTTTTTGPASPSNPTGTSTTTSTPVNNLTYTTNNYSTATTTVTVAGDTTTVTSAPADKVEVCGLPGKPACLIDETGTPTRSGLETEADKVDPPSKPPSIGLDAAGHAASALSWIWGFSLPTGVCETFDVTSPTAPTIPAIVDICSSPYALIWRQLLAWFAYVIAGLYIWRSATAAVGTSKV